MKIPISHSTTPATTPAILLIVADNHRARLLTERRDPSGHPRVSLLASLREQWEPRLHDNPPSRSDAAGHTFENRGHMDGERIHRFAKELASWLGRELRGHELDRLCLFAPAHLLGALRSETSKTLQLRWSEHESDLGGLTEGELAKRPEIASLLT